MLLPQYNKMKIKAILKKYNSLEISIFDILFINESELIPSSLGAS